MCGIGWTWLVKVFKFTGFLSNFIFPSLVWIERDNDLLYLSPSWNIWPTSIPFFTEYFFQSFSWSWSFISWSSTTRRQSSLLYGNSVRWISFARIAKAVDVPVPASNPFSEIYEPAWTVEVKAGAIIPVLVLLEMKWYLVRGWTLGHLLMVWSHLYIRPKNWYWAQMIIYERNAYGSIFI